MIAISGRDIMSYVAGIGIILCSLLFSGCSFSPVTIPPVSVYTLDGVTYAPTTRQPRTDLTLLVSKPVAAPGYVTNDMQYMRTAYQLQHFAEHRWIAPPSEMLLRVVSGAIQNTGHFKAVVVPPFSGLTDYDLETDVLAFEQNFMRPISRFIFVMQADLIDSHTHCILASRRFSKTVDAEVNTPFGGVLAANQAVESVSREIARFVVQNTRPRL